MAIILELSSGATTGPISGVPPVWRASSRSRRASRVAEVAMCEHGATSPNEAVAVHEKLIGENNLRPVAFLQQALRMSEAVALIQVPSRGSATGFMVSADVAMTNNHVLRSYEEAATSRLRFGYEYDVSGRLRASEYFPCRPDLFFYTNVELDYSLVAVGGSPGLRYGTITLSPQALAGVGSEVTIIQHPLGQPKQIAMVDNEIVFADETIAQYLTDTLPGSSGSPVFNEAWELVALHHSGGWVPEPGDESTHFRNEGIRVAAIVRDLRSAGLA